MEGVQRHFRVNIPPTSKKVANATLCTFTFSLQSCYLPLECLPQISQRLCANPTTGVTSPIQNRVGGGHRDHTNVHRHWRGRPWGTIDWAVVIIKQQSVRIRTRRIAIRLRNDRMKPKSIIKTVFSNFISQSQEQMSCYGHQQFCLCKSQGRFFVNGGRETSMICWRVEYKVQ